MKNIYALLAILLCWQISSASQSRKVLIIGIDGTRSDALQMANTPNIDALLPNALYTYDSWHTAITWSGPSWATILTGVYWDKHGVKNNLFLGKNFAQHPPIPTLAKQIKPDLNCAIVAEWDPLIDDIDNAAWNKKVKVPDTESWITADSAIAQLQDPDIDLLFAYFDKVDMTGHSTGFDTLNPLYINAIQIVDSAVGKVLNALYARPDYANENWLIFLVTDHGGSSLSHGGNSYDERHAWWIASGSVVSHEQITKADPGTYNCNNDWVFDRYCVDKNLMQASPVHPDIAVTALHHLLYDTLNPETKTEWALDGKSWLMTPSAVHELITTETISVYPSPNNGIFTVQGVQFAANQNLAVEVFSLEGKKVFSAIPQTDKLQIDLSNLQRGFYLLKVGDESAKVLVQ